MLFKLHSLNKLICISAVAQLFSTTDVLAQTASRSTPPAPIWSGYGDIPKSNGDRKVFLTPDEHSVVLLWPDQNGAESKLRRLPLHNVIRPELRVRIENNFGDIVYSYDLKNTRQSEDSITTFSIVIYPDPNLQVGAELWTGGKSTAAGGQRIGLPKAPPGGLAIWFCPDSNPLLPGTATRFKLTTSARPGFTTAATEHFPHLDTSDEWPQQILDELDPVLDPHWIDQHIITFGPRYGPDESAASIAADYRVGIQELILQRQIEPTSAFAQDVMAYLEKVLHDSSAAPLALTAKPHSELEVEILNALRLSLHVTDERK
jgi:hypothetical protein